MNQLNVQSTSLYKYPTCIPHPHHQTPPLSQALQLSFKYPLSMRGLREFLKSVLNLGVHRVYQMCLLTGFIQTLTYCYC